MSPDDPPISQEELLAYNKWRRRQGLAIQPIKYPKIVRTLSISNEAWERLQILATEQGFVYGDHGNVSMLLESIGQGILVVQPNS
jgi:hypothetical protein